MYTATDSHPNSRPVTIFRASSFLARAQGKEIDNFFADARKSIGAYFAGGASSRVGSGLTFEEENILMPSITEVDASDREFRKKVAEFFNNIDTVVPYRGGITLETGLLKDNGAKVTIDNMPINLEQFLRWRHALGHPQVAPSKEAADGSTLKEFYVFDKTEASKKNSKRNEEKDLALKLYLDMKVSIIKVDMMLTLLGIDPRSIDSEDERKEALKRLAEKEPKKFLEVGDNKDLETHATIKTMVNLNILQQLAGKYVDGETKKIIGNSLDEMGVWFNDEENSDVVRLYKERLQEKMRVPSTRRKARATV